MRAVGHRATTQNVLVVNPGVAAKLVKELVALAKAKPGELRYGSGGNGNARLTDSGFDIARDTSEEGYARFIRSEIAKWAELVRKTGIKGE